MLIGYVERVKEFALPVSANLFDAYLEFCKTTLCDTAPFFDTALIAEAGLDRGLLDQSEAERLKVFSIFPDRIFQALNPAPNFDPESIKTRSLCQQEMVQLNSCSFADAEPAALKPFGSIACTAPEITLISGESSWHCVRNFTKLSWTEAGIIPSISDRRGLALHPSFDCTSPVELDHSFLAVVEGSSVYIHWLLDTFPRLLLAKEAGIDFNDFNHLVLATAQSRFHQYCLSKLGVPMDKVVTRQLAGNYFKTSSFVTVSAPREHCVAHPTIYQTVAEFLQDTAGFSKSTLDRSFSKIYVSREKASRRKVVNEEELVAVLELFGYKRVFLEDLDQPEVMRLFASAQCIVAVHGAGLANLIFSNPGTKVIELFSGHISKDYWIICSQLQLQYGIFQAMPPGRQTVGWKALQDIPFFERNAMNMHVDCSRLTRLLEDSGMT